MQLFEVGSGKAEVGKSTYGAMGAYVHQLPSMYYSIVKVCFFSKDFRQPVFSAREVY
jgi:hypothetical protein